MVKALSTKKTVFFSIITAKRSFQNLILHIIKRINLTADFRAFEECDYELRPCQTT